MLKRSPYQSISLIFLGVAVVCYFFADLEISTINPWREMGRMALGVITPNFLEWDILFKAIGYTLAFALMGVSLGALFGFGMALLFHFRLIRMGCAGVRAVHELFWALLFLQFLGLNPLTGLLAICIPYAGVFAKVYSEILEEADTRPIEALPGGSSHVSAFFFVRLPEAWPHLISYTAYRLECGMRSSAILGFVGLPTLGYHLETYFRQGQYSQVSALLIIFFLMIATLRWWARPRLIGLYLVAALYTLWGPLDISLNNIARFFSSDIVPYPIRQGMAPDGGNILQNLSEWSWELVWEQALPGAFATLLLTQIALVATGILTLALFPLVSKKFFGPVGRTIGHLVLVIMRSVPEYILAYIFLQLWGPSMLPAIVALAIHNGAIIAHLTGRHSDEIALREDAPHGLNLYGYEILPRVYGQFLAFLFYRWEVILRETAILGMLGIHTLGFYVDSAIQDIRMDRALFLIVLTAGLNIGVDMLSRRIRSSLRLTIRADLD